jgi:hypothetical protein
MACDLKRDRTQFDIQRLACKSHYITIDHVIARILDVNLSHTAMNYLIIVGRMGGWDSWWPEMGSVGFLVARDGSVGVMVAKIRVSWISGDQKWGLWDFWCPEMGLWGSW